MRKYNIINNSLGWLCFAIAAVTYLLTLEPTASFWDCPEFISQGYKLEVGHPPGNPIFMLAARFFVNFTGGDVTKVAVAVNTMSTLLSAATILLLFWTITHLVRRLITKDDAADYTAAEMISIFGSGLVGALAYTWSDTFWFSAVEGEVYAFSSFCTALVFWLILKWENRADQPHSDSYLILIAYVIGISIAVHLLNLLCIPAIVLVFYYKKFKNINAKGSMIALCVSFVIVALILYGLVPGFIEVAQYFELMAVNGFGWSYNSGVVLYTVITLATFIWAITEIYRQKNPARIKLSFALSILFSGIPFIGSSLFIPVLIMIALGAWLIMSKSLPVRILNIIVLSVFVIFIGYSSYALLLIRSSANTPMNQNGPDNVFSLSSYLNREQYGQRPLFFGETFTSDVLRDASGSPIYKTGEAEYSKTVKTDSLQPDRYDVTGYAKTPTYMPELDMLFPRMYSPDADHRQAYMDWLGINESDLSIVQATSTVDANGNTLDRKMMRKPTFSQNLQFFINYQLVHMYLRYFMWNFAGRQNDIQGNGEVNHGNWISGIPLIDNPRLGDQSLLPDDIGRGNKGHNVFYMLPLLLGIIGLLWQSFSSQRGIEQFWVVFFLFFMTGIAIVLYLNQTPLQPRERDYAFAGSFYAFAIWIGMGVAAIAEILRKIPVKDSGSKTHATGCAALATVIGLIVPLQMVSQTWDDHDRSGRYTTRDFGMNYLSSLDDNAIIFTNGDNDTFPLWYAQEVEGYRTDVRVVNLSYLTTDWYANQQLIPSYEAAGIPMTATAADFGQNRRQYSIVVPSDTTPTPMLGALRQLYSPEADVVGERLGVATPVMIYNNVYIPVDIDQAVAAGRITPEEATAAETSIDLMLVNPSSSSWYRGLNLSQALTLDILATDIVDSLWSRPVYFAMTVPNRYYMGLDKYLRSTGMAYEVSPIIENGSAPGVNTDKMYRNVMERFRWGGIAESKDRIYLDETVRRMVTTTRSTLLDLAYALYTEGRKAEIAAVHPDYAGVADSTEFSDFARERYLKALDIMNLMVEKLPVEPAPYGVQMGQQVGDMFVSLGDVLGDPDITARGAEILEHEIRLYGQHLIYMQHLKPWQYSLLPQNDRYVRRLQLSDGPKSYFLDLLLSYNDAADRDSFRNLLVELQDQGVDFSLLPLTEYGFGSGSDNQSQPQAAEGSAVGASAS